MNWFCSYLSNRKQFTVYDNNSSNLCNTDFGVPQGGVLSPLLFIIYINDITRCTNLADTVIYADDTTVHVTASNIMELYSKSNAALNDYYTWFSSNKLTLNAQKTQYILFHRKQKLVPSLECNLNINNTPIHRVQHAKFLGVIIDCNLSWSSHISNTARKIAKYAPIIYRIRNLCTKESIKLIYHCNVH